jgi:uncharacterized protein (DUF2336 family)
MFPGPPGRMQAFGMADSTLSLSQIPGPSVVAASEATGLDMLGPRRVLLKRLMDVVALPSSRGSVQDRAIAGDLLLELLTLADEPARALCARRLKEMSQAPRRLLRYLAIDAPSIACEIISENRGLDDDDFVYIVTRGGPEHRLAVARRFDIGPSASTAIAESRDPEAITALLQNLQAKLSERAVDVITGVTRDAPDLSGLLLQREEIRPAHALAMFWWCGADERRAILWRFSAERTHLIDGCADIFRESYLTLANDPVLQKALKVIERRQRNRAALAASPYASLEEAVDAAAATGLTTSMVEEISHLAGIRPATGQRIFGDKGGEAVAILCKATGLKRRYLQQVWTAMGRSSIAGDPDYERVSTTFEAIAVAKAQTVLRYWDWRLGSAFAPDAADPTPPRAVATVAPD